MAITDRWKYLVVTIPVPFGRQCTGRGLSDERLQAELDQQGLLGWELVQIVKSNVHSQLVFKRPM